VQDSTSVLPLPGAVKILLTETNARDNLLQFLIVCSDSEETMQKALGMMLLVVGMSAFAFGTAVPEIGVGSAGSAFALLSGALLVIRGSRKK
jgi:hypothetical protein